MRITDYEQVSALNNEDIFLIDGQEGTKTITALNAAKALYSKITTEEARNKLDLKNIRDSEAFFYNSDPPIGDNFRIVGIEKSDGSLLSIYGGQILPFCADNTTAYYQTYIRNLSIVEKNYGGTFTSEQLARIRDGSFKGLYLGAYWLAEPDKLLWRIVDFNYYYESTSSGDQSHIPHIVVICENYPGFKTWDDAGNNPTTKGFKGSKLYAELSNVVTQAKKIFGDAVFNMKEIVSTNQTTIEGTWENVEIGAMVPMTSQFMGFFNPLQNRQTRCIAGHQFSLMRVNPHFIHSGRSTGIWFRDILQDNKIAMLDYQGGISYASVNSNGISLRPYCVIM